MDTRPSLLFRLRDAADADAWASFVEVYAPFVYRFARRRGLQDADAADITQDVLTEVARSIRGFEYRRERGRFRDWLLLITPRRLGRFFAAQARTPRENPHGDLFAEAPDDAQTAEWTEEFNARVLQAALERIRPHFELTTWRAFECVWLERKSAVETAGNLSLQIETVYHAKSRVLKRLAHEVEQIVEDFSWLDDLQTP
jgi:RNA polymerase sigma-70 factor (ECF subfamily)